MATRQFPRQGRASRKKGGNFSPARVTDAIRVSACAMVLIVADGGAVWAAVNCEVPKAFSLAVEERPLLGPGGPGLVVVGAAKSSSLRAGDVLRQVNGRRMLHCEDLETTAADALAKGLLLLTAVERDGALLVVGLGDTGVAAAVEAPAAPVLVAAPPEGTPGAPNRPRRVPEESAPAPAPTAAPTPVVVREVTLPPRTSASAELAAKTVAAAALLATIDEAARFAVPLLVYERRVEEGANALAALHIEGEGSEAVRGIVTEALGYHQTARDIRRYKAQELSHARVDLRGAAALSLSYFSDSQVPHWIERYPFLSESLQDAPRTTHLLLPGEMAGRWNPDQAVELLWARAAAAAARLGTWAAAQ